MGEGTGRFRRPMRMIISASADTTRPGLRGCKDVLPAPAELPELVYQVILNPRGVQGVLGLVNDQRLVPVSEGDDQDRGALLAVGQALDHLIAVGLGLAELNGERVGKIDRLELTFRTSQS